MYEFLNRFLSPRLAEVALTAWYLFLMVLILACLRVPTSEFRYANL